MSPDSFINQIAPLAVAEQRRTGVLASITIAQAALESGWGRAAPGNNLFGIKGSGQEFTTQEYQNGHFVTITDGFRVYDSWAGSIIDHSNFLLENRIYRGAGFFDACAELDYAAAARALKRAGYATDPSYAVKLIGIISAHQLFHYDEEGSVDELTWEEQKQQILQEAVDKGIIENPDEHRDTLDESAPKWMILKVTLNAIRYITGK